MRHLRLFYDTSLWTWKEVGRVLDSQPVGKALRGAQQGGCCLAARFHDLMKGLDFPTQAIPLQLFYSVIERYHRHCCIAFKHELL